MHRETVPKFNCACGTRIYIVVSLLQYNTVGLDSRRVNVRERTLDEIDWHKSAPKNGVQHILLTCTRNSILELYSIDRNSHVQYSIEAADRRSL